MDVEGILNQIRERVASEQAVRRNDTALPAPVHSNGSAVVTSHDDVLQRLRTHLAIAGRAADRLPPVFSNRQGTRARLELWLKNKSKPLTRWFTWEQVNFNRAVNDALGDVVDLLKSQAQELAAVRAQLSGLQVETGRVQELFQAEIAARLQAADARVTEVATETRQRDKDLASSYARLQIDHSNLVAEHTKLADQVIELAAQLRAADQAIKSEQNQEISRRLSQLAADLKEEQRVCFRQISLETGEAAVLEDRARRALLTRVEKLEADSKTSKR